MYAGTSGGVLELVGVLCDDSHAEHSVAAGIVVYLGGSQDEVGELELSFRA
jgi:hypothetical protein